MKATDSDWELLISELSTIDLTELFDGKFLDEVTDILIEKLEAAVIKHMKKLDCSKPSGYSSNNLIPKRVRKLFKRKCKRSKQLKSVTSVSRCISIRDNILKIDIELKTHYEDRR